MTVLVRFICAFLLISSTTAFFINSEVGKEMEEIVPKEVKTFYESLNEDDRSVLQQVLGKTSQYTNLSEVLTDLRNGSSTLYDKAVGLVTDVRGTVAALSPSARKFVDETVEQVQRVFGETFSFSKIKAEANVVVARYGALDDKTKKELMDSFPLANSILNNTVFQTLAAGLLGIGASS
ncbi:Fatty-acid and retinol-binding protein 7 [Aphelenchoides besseyi]|nr:Fatty-acid and retinol-binding protein 7 [Aphelenchoides besseyi]KAI6235097.1 Fatty-acid and retinol-binding protein 7 [Aphelenchoides besseyi]